MMKTKNNMYYNALVFSLLKLQSERKERNKRYNIACGKIYCKAFGKRKIHRRSEPQGVTDIPKDAIKVR